MNEPMGVTFSDKEIRGWISNLPNYLSFFKSAPNGVDLGRVFENGLNADFSETEYHEICEKLGPGGRLRLLSLLLSDTGEDFAAFMLNTMIEGDGFSKHLEREISEFTASLEEPIKIALSNDPKFMSAIKAALSAMPHNNKDKKNVVPKVENERAR